MKRRGITLWPCVAFAVGSMVGAGVFVLTGVAIRDAGPAALISFSIAGLAVLCSAFSFMKIASLVQAGELGYAPVGRALGNMYWSFLTAWSFYISAIFCTAFVLNAFGLYFHDFFAPALSPTVLAVAAAAVMTIINLGPASQISRIEGMLVGVKVIVLLLLIAFGLAHLAPHDFQPFAPHGSQSILATSGLLFIAYLGFSVVTNIASDVESPKQTVPRAIFISILSVIALYMGVVLALLAAPPSSYNEASIGHVASTLMGPIGGIIIPLAALVSTLSAANSNILGSSEIMMRLAAQRDVPTAAGRLWHGHPVVSVLFGAAVYSLLLASGQAEATIALANTSAITAIVLVNSAAIRLALQGATTAQRAQAILPALGLIGCIVQLWLLGIPTLLLGLGFMLFGSLIYMGRKRFHHTKNHRQLLQDIQRLGGPLVRALHRKLP